MATKSENLHSNIAVNLHFKSLQISSPALFLLSIPSPVVSEMQNMPVLPGDVPRLGPPDIGRGTVGPTILRGCGAWSGLFLAMAELPHESVCMHTRGAPYA